MTWTTDKPTKPGWYWLAKYTVTPMVVLFDGEWARGPFWDARIEKIKDGEWAGPLEPPEAKP